MTAALTVRADPAVWQVVPADADAAWIDRQVQRAAEHARPAVADAAALAVLHRRAGDLSLALFLSLPEAGMFGMLGIAGVDVPAPSDVETAGEVAAALLPSPWPAEGLAVEIGAARGWRFTVLDGGPDGSSEPVVVAQTVSTAYVLDLQGRCVVAALTPMAPLAATVAQALAERALSTLEREDADVR
ncbi:hypothetical protein N3K63_05370 [Microbacterium sp. W1N]|uniref:hypothetical protein n=1 Tax=Microbacterium festucae TaxID=2977531 RepID=UPI0021C1E7B5|nr:hypothetical protein [Microbacterium festucae]MCT9819715.1 hypothetical protein [Microbacterium festucae]